LDKEQFIPPLQGVGGPWGAARGPRGPTWPTSANGERLLREANTERMAGLYPDFNRARHRGVLGFLEGSPRPWCARTLETRMPSTHEVAEAEGIFHRAVFLEKRVLCLRRGRRGAVRAGQERPRDLRGGAGLNPLPTLLWLEFRKPRSFAVVLAGILLLVGVGLAPSAGWSRKP